MYDKIHYKLKKIKSECMKKKRKKEVAGPGIEGKWAEDSLSLLRSWLSLALYLVAVEQLLGLTKLSRTGE